MFLSYETKDLKGWGLMVSWGNVLVLKCFRSDGSFQKQLWWRGRLWMDLNLRFSHFSEPCSLNPVHICAALHLSSSCQFSSAALTLPSARLFTAAVGRLPVSSHMYPYACRLSTICSSPACPLLWFCPHTQPVSYFGMIVLIRYSVRSPLRAFISR